MKAETKMNAHSQYFKYIPADQKIGGIPRLKWRLDQLSDYYLSLRKELSLDQVSAAASEYSFLLGRLRSISEEEE